MGLRDLKRTLSSEMKLYHTDKHAFGIVQICKLLDLLKEGHLMPVQEAKEILQEWIDHDSIPDNPIKS